VGTVPDRPRPRPHPPVRSPDWLALPEGHPAKVAAVVRAAEAWASTGDDLTANLSIEVDRLRTEHKRLDDAGYVARADAHRRDTRFSRDNRPTFAERRAAQLDDARPRPDDYGGSS
jgi:hypothetical protein